LLYLVSAAVVLGGMASGLLWHHRRASQDPARTIDTFQRRIQALGSTATRGRRR
jgi:hypothetical protein